MHQYLSDFPVKVVNINCDCRFSIVVFAVSLQTFDIQLVNVTQGATIGTDDCVRIGILPSDSSIGVFSITPHQVTTLSQWMHLLNVELKCIFGNRGT